jgi:hypothetical protein
VAAAAALALATPFAVRNADAAVTPAATSDKTAAAASSTAAQVLADDCWDRASRARTFSTGNVA